MSEDRGPASGTQFGPYQIGPLLGKGGMGAVYEAYDTVKDRTVALKLLHERFAKNAGYQERFRRESRAAARLQEPHVIPIHDWGEIGGVLYIDMRLVKGADLRSVLNREGTLRPGRAVGIITQIAAALDAAHADNLVHRDVKPENILVTENDFSYLVDFGIANNATEPSLTSAGTAIGSYAYMAPERFEGTSVTARADIYSLACVLYECLTGQTPFPSGSVSVLMLAHMNNVPQKPSAVQRDVTPALDAAVARGLAKNPADRFATAAEFARAAQQGVTPGGTEEEPTAVVDSSNVPTFAFPRPPHQGRNPHYPPPGGQQWQEPPTNPFPPPANYQPQQHIPPPYPVYEAPPSGGRSTAVKVAIAVLILAIVGLGAAIGWVQLSNSDGEDSAKKTVTSGASGEPTSAGSSPTRSTRSSTTTARPTGPVQLPPGATECPPRYGPTSDYTTSATGTEITSCEFAEEVRAAYAGGGAPGQSRQAVATSPRTGETYTMSCAAGGRLVTCTGGNNAVVYVY